MNLENQVWLITGVSSGIGRAVAQQVIHSGGIVAGTLRRKAQFADFEALAPGRAFPVLMDITNSEQVKSGVASVIEKFGKINVLLNNAGYGLVGALEETSETEARRVFKTNVFGTLGVTREVLPYMRANKGGRVITVSAIAGFVGFPGFGVYSATKFAIEGMMEALAKEAKPLNIQSTLITAGVFRTQFAGNALQFTEQVIEDYASTAGGFRKGISQLDGNQPNDPEKAAEAIIKIANADAPPIRVFLGEDALKWGRDKLEQVAREIDQWESLSLSTRFVE